MEKTKKRGIGDFFSRREMDIPFLILVLILLTIGLIMLFSASYTYASYNYGSSTYYFKKQFIYALIGIAGMLFVSRINYKYFRIFGLIGFAVSILMLLYVFVQPEVVPGFKRWILIPGIGMTVQPSEVAKMALIMVCAWGMEKYHRSIVGKGRSELIYRLSDGKVRFPAHLVTTAAFGGTIVITALLVYLENHLSGAILILSIGVVMLWLGEFRRSWFIVFGSLAVLAAVYVVFNPELLKEYAGDRITAWLDKDFDPMGLRWQINQSLYAIGSGGLLGTGLGNSMQKHLYVSEPQNDFIFAVVCEELGFVGAALIMVLFALLVWRGVLIGVNARDKFGSLLAMGMVFLVGVNFAI